MKELNEKQMACILGGDKIVIKEKSVERTDSTTVKKKTF